MKGTLSILIAIATMLFSPVDNAFAKEAGRAGVNDLRNTKWRLATINGAAPAAQPSPTLAFQHQYRISGSNGCDPIFGIYGEDKTNIAIRTAASASTPCVEAVALQEDALMKILSSSPELYLRADGALVIRASAGELVLTKSNE